MQLQFIDYKVYTPPHTHTIKLSGKGVTVTGPLFVDLTNAFNPHQGLTAISRVTKLENLQFVGFKDHFMIDNHTLTFNRQIRQIHQERLARLAV